jgi:hypothetical protein
MIKRRKRTRDEVQRTLELRRSNIAQPHRNKSKYTRKIKHPKSLTTDS